MGNTSKELMEKVSYVVNDFNALQEVHGLKSRISYMYDANNPASGKLVMGTEEQFQYGSYQCVIAEGIDESYTAAKALNMYHCFEYGE